MRLLVCGGRDYTNVGTVWATLNAIHAATPIRLVIHGAARGADTLAKKWALENHVMQTPVPADWDKHGKAAGAIRNQRMLDEYNPSHVLAFPGGRGTADMVRRARAAGLPVREIHA